MSAATDGQAATARFPTALAPLLWYDPAMNVPLMDWYVYTHARPCGTVFYVGKGTGRRAWDLSPSRRKRHHMNVVRKHGRDNILIKVIPAASEPDALRLECELIAQHLRDGVRLVNLTAGGEGSSRPPTKTQIAALEAGRLSWAERGLSAQSIERMREGLDSGREKWRADPKFLDHIVKLGYANRGKRPDPIAIVCAQCRCQAVVRSPKARFCSSFCAQRYSREHPPDQPVRKRPPERSIVCVACSKAAIVRSGAAKCCSRACAQRHRLGVRTDGNR